MFWHVTELNASKWFTIMTEVLPSQHMKDHQMAYLYQSLDIDRLYLWGPFRLFHYLNHQVQGGLLSKSTIFRQSPANRIRKNASGIVNMITLLCRMCRAMITLCTCQASLQPPSKGASVPGWRDLAAVPINPRYQRLRPCAVPLQASVPCSLSSSTVSHSRPWTISRSVRRWLELCSHPEQIPNNRSQN